MHFSMEEQSVQLSVGCFGVCLSTPVATKSQQNCPPGHHPANSLQRYSARAGLRVLAVPPKCAVRSVTTTTAAAASAATTAAVAAAATAAIFVP